MTAPEHLDRLVAEATPWPQQHVDSLPLADARRDLLEDLMSTPLVDQPQSRRTQPRARRRARWVVPVAVMLAVMVVVGVPFWLGGHGPSPESSPYSAADQRIADANPRLLVTAPGWSVSSVDAFTLSEGEMTFTDGRHELDLSWRAAGTYRSYLEDRQDVGRPRPITLLGQRGQVFRYSAADFTTILPPSGPNFLEIRGNLARPAYVRVLRSLEHVGADQWLASLPPSVVRPSDMDAAVASMLRGIPLPAGFDTAPLSVDLPSDRYQVGAAVSGSVACAWLDRWADAREAGDTQAADAAAAALDTSRSWPVLREMNAEGDYPEVLWETAAAANGRNLSAFDGELPTREVWDQGLGCTEAPMSANVTP